MMIDPETVKNLELVRNISARKSNHTLFGCVNHHLGDEGWMTELLRRTLNYTFTAMGGRLLRVNILSPITGECFSHIGLSYKRIILDPQAVNARLDVVAGGFPASPGCSEMPTSDIRVHST